MLVYIRLGRKGMGISRNEELTKIKPVVSGPRAMEEEKGIKSTWRMEKGETRHCGHSTLLISLDDLRYVAVVLSASWDMMPFARPMTAGIVIDIDTTWFLAEAKYNVAAVDGSYSESPSSSAFRRFDDALGEICKTAHACSSTTVFRLHASKLSGTSPASTKVQRRCGAGA